MASAVRPKTADKQALIKKLQPVVKKFQKTTVIPEFPVMETLLFAACLEDVSLDEGIVGYDRLRASFDDLNEARVSSVTELREALGNIYNDEWKAYRFKGLLQHVFDKNYTFEFEGLKKRTLELAQKQLQKIKLATPFIRTYTLHAVLGAHLLPLDERSRHALIWLGLATPDQSADDIGESLKATIKKSEVDQFCIMIRSLATTPELVDAFDPEKLAVPEGGHDMMTAMERLAELMKHGAAVYIERNQKKVTKAEAAAAAKPVKAAVKKAKKVAAEEEVPVAEPVKTKAAEKAAKEVVEKPVKEVAEKPAKAKPAKAKAEPAPKAEAAPKAAEKPAKAAKSTKAEAKVEAKPEPKTKAKTSTAKSSPKAEKAVPAKKTSAKSKGTKSASKKK